MDVAQGADINVCSFSFDKAGCTTQNLHNTGVIMSFDKPEHNCCHADKENHQLLCCHKLGKTKKKEKTTASGVKLMTSRVSCQAAQVKSWGRW